MIEIKDLTLKLEDKDILKNINLLLSYFRKPCCEGRYGLFFKYKCYLCNAIPMIFDFRKDLGDKQIQQSYE